MYVAVVYTEILHSVCVQPLCFLAYFRCVHLMAELSQLTLVHQPIASMLPTLANAVSHRDYTQHLVLLESLCKRVSY